MSGNDAEDGRERVGDATPDGDLSARLKRLETQIERKRPPASPAHSSRSGSGGGPSPLGQATRLSTEFIAGVIAGGVLGYLFDRTLGTAPWGMIVLLMLGFLTGVYNAMRASGFIRPPSGRDGRGGT